MSNDFVIEFPEFVGFTELENIELTASTNFTCLPGNLAGFTKLTKLYDHIFLLSLFRANSSVFWSVGLSFQLATFAMIILPISRRRYQQCM